MTKHAFDLSGTSDRLISGFRDFIGDAEQLLRATAEYSGESIASARSQLQDRLQHAKSAVADAETVTLEQARKAAASAGKLARDNPWGVIAIALGLGLAVGLLGRRQ